jgi:hypothetical protein
MRSDSVSSNHDLEEELLKKSGGVKPITAADASDHSMLALPL